MPRIRLCNALRWASSIDALKVERPTSCLDFLQLGQHRTRLSKFSIPPISVGTILSTQRVSSVIGFPQYIHLQFVSLHNLRIHRAGIRASQLFDWCISRRLSNNLPLKDGSIPDFISRRTLIRYRIRCASGIVATYSIVPRLALSLLQARQQAIAFSELLSNPAAFGLI